MSRRPVYPPTICTAESHPRRSARIQQRQKPLVQSPANPARRGRTNGDFRATFRCTSTVGPRRKREGQTEVEDCNVTAAKKRSLRSSDAIPSQESEKTKSKKRGVRFDDDQPLEPLPDDKADGEAVARAAAAAITVESLATRPENAQYASLDPRVFPCASDARARFAPTRTLDSKGRIHIQYPIRYILAYRIEVGALYTYLKSVKRDLHDFQGTLLHCQPQLDEGLNMRRQDGMTEMVYMGRRIWSMIMSQSDRPETLPYPTARIQKFQEIMGCKCEPLIYPFRPRAHRLQGQAK